MPTSPISASSFYHLFADGDWEYAALEYALALEKSGFSGKRYVGIVGSPANRQRARSALPPGFTVAAEANEGHEQVTLWALHEWAKTANPDTAVLYAHTKGAKYSTGLRSNRWRHAMIHETVMAGDKVSRLIPEFDAVGAGWQETPNNFFFGNFWWARAGYLSGLAPVSDKTRYHAEHWLGTGNPRVKDLCPDFGVRYNIDWNFYFRLFNSGRPCSECSLGIEIV